jgi:hypothetical protein
VLLSEEGIAKGIRRVVALTAAEAQQAIAAGEKLRERFDNAAAMPPQQLEAELGSLKQVGTPNRCWQAGCCVAVAGSLPTVGCSRCRAGWHVDTAGPRHLRTSKAVVACMQNPKPQEVICSL